MRIDIVLFLRAHDRCTLAQSLAVVASQTLAHTGAVAMEYNLVGARNVEAID